MQWRVAVGPHSGEEVHSPGFLTMALADDIQSLKDEKSAILLALKNDAVTGPRPSDSFDGQSVDYVGWRRQLGERLTQINEQLSQMELIEDYQVGM